MENLLIKTSRTTEALAKALPRCPKYRPPPTDPPSTEKGKFWESAQDLHV